jgi:hypothetical protein
MITVGVDILDGSFEVDFDYRLLSPKGEEPLRFEPLRQSLRLRRAGSRVSIYIPVWMRTLMVANLPEMSDVYMAVAINEGINIS